MVTATIVTAMVTAMAMAMVTAMAMGGEVMAIMMKKKNLNSSKPNFNLLI